MLSNLAHLRDNYTIEALPSSGLAYMLCQHVHRGASFLVITASDERAKGIAMDMQSLGIAANTGVQALSSHSDTPFAEVLENKQAIFDKQILHQHIMTQTQATCLVVSAAFVQDAWCPDADFKQQCMCINTGAHIARDTLAQTLRHNGYQQVPFVEDEGTFAVRGGVIDIFLPSMTQPVRLDLFGDDLTSIKFFDVAAQHTSTALEQIIITPVHDALLDDAHVSHAIAWLQAYAQIVDIPNRHLRQLYEALESRRYFYGIEALWPAFFSHTEYVLDALLTTPKQIVLDEPEAIFAVWEARYAQSEQQYQRAVQHHKPVVALASHLDTPQALRAKIAQRACLYATSLAFNEADCVRPFDDLSALQQDIAIRRKDSSQGEVLEPIVQWVKQAKSGLRVIIMCNSTSSAKNLQAMLLARGLDVPINDAFLPQWLSQQHLCTLTIGVLSSSLYDAEKRYVLLSEAHLFASTIPLQKNKKSKRVLKADLNTLAHLQDNDLVIHQQYGIGRYKGLHRLVVNGIDADYAKLHYADDDKLYVPVYHLNLIQPYRGNQHTARLDKLGSNQWQRTKERIKDAMLAMAHHILAVQAARQAKPGFRCIAPNADFRAMEALFPFEETVDQQRAIDDVLHDLQQDKPMDRLVCGDVGFGKTEVAIRAAYLAVLSGKQVAVLVPTTVLAEQHCRTFMQRLEHTGAHVASLSRFLSAKEAKQVLQNLRLGHVDIVIGTHRLLSDDVMFKNLGLLIIDEEQRFGVGHKERLKKLRHDVHVLTLSATPIPRTLHMATVGIRDLSMIQTPPAARSAIHTHIVRFDETVIQDSIRRELQGGGQVFMVHNRIQSIETMAKMIRKLVPEARVAVAHGQMQAHTLEHVMVNFVRQAYDVLVCTAIIENGIDMPTVNTMLVNRADTFGLSQLYQLRGRIGRGSKPSYVYFLVPENMQLSQEATDRLALLKRFSNLGSGLQIALEDLELRGAGDLLGANQSGHIAAVGFSLYTELLTQAIEHVRGSKQMLHIEPDIHIPVSAVIEATYMPDPIARLNYYQRMCQATTDAEIVDVYQEMQGLYGPATGAAVALLDVMRIRLRLKHLGATRLSVKNETQRIVIVLNIADASPIDRNALLVRCTHESHIYKLLSSERLAIHMPQQQLADDATLLQTIYTALNTLAVLPEAANTCKPHTSSANPYDS